MFCLSINKPIVANATSVPQKSDSPSSSSSSPPPKQGINNVPPNLKPMPSSSLGATKTAARNKLRQMQIERAVGAGSYRDGDLPSTRESDMKKTVFDLFLGQAIESPVEKNMRKTGEWLAANAEPKFQSSRKGILIFAFKWILPIWGISLLIACGAIKLPFSTPFLDDLLM